MTCEACLLLKKKKKQLYPLLATEKSILCPVQYRFLPDSSIRRVLVWAEDQNPRGQYIDFNMY